MLYEFIDWPERGWRRGGRPEPDEALVAALIEASVNGRAIGVDTPDGGIDVIRDPAQGRLYPMGYNVHQKRVGERRYALRAVRDRLVCDTCSYSYDMVNRIAAGGDRLRRRDPCEQAGCIGRVIEPEDVETT